MRPPVWELVQSDGDRCGGTGCPEFKTCAYWRARLDAARAAILVVNHHLFFADLAVRRQTGDYRTAFVLPGWQRVVLDEAHDLEDAASSFFGVTLTRRGILRRLGRLRSRQNTERGTFPALCRKLMKLGEATLAAHIQGVVMPAVEGAGARVESLFSRIEEAIEPLAGVENAALRYRGEDTPWNGLFAACRETARRIKELRDGVKKVQAPLIDRADENTALAPAVLEVHAVCRRLESLEKDLEFFADADDPDQVRWIEMRRSRGAPYAVCRSAPFLVGPQLEESLWRPVPTCILTSATLSVDGGFAYLASRLGLDRLGPARFRFLTIPSPFDWKRQAVLLVPTDMQDVGTDLFREDLARWIIDAVRITRGRAFVLFTSYGMLGRAHDDVCETLEGMGLDVLRQGMAPRSLLLEEFRRSGKAVLFGTESFWQGVDVRGEALSCVIIARLPFAVPTEPLQMARMEEVKARGRDAFREFSLPQAVLKLRQGVGRLLRAVGDRGAVIVLDRRIAARSYGRTFLQSLPPMRRVLGEGADLKDALSAFFNGAANGGASRCCS